MDAIKTIDVANSLILAAGKARTLAVALTLVEEPLEAGRTRDVAEHAIRNLAIIADRLVDEGNTLQRWAATEDSE